MSNSAAAEGAEVFDGALQREADQLARRFPHADRADILRRMRETYARLEHEATIKSHLVTITAGIVGNTLRAGGPPTS